jgi:hypothetical protein
VDRKLRRDARTFVCSGVPADAPSHTGRRFIERHTRLNSTAPKHFAGLCPVDGVTFCVLDRFVTDVDGAGGQRQ